MANIQISVPIRKASKQMVFGFANVASEPDGTAVIDTYGEIIPPEVLERAAYDYVLRYREGGLEHEKMGVARLVESCFITAEKIEAMGLSAGSFKGAAWWVGFKVDDPEVWEMVEKGELGSFSIGGTCTREPIKE